MSSGAAGWDESTVVKSTSGRNELTFRKKSLIFLVAAVIFFVFLIFYWVMSGSINISFFGTSEQLKYTLFALSSTLNALGAVLVAIGGFMQYKALHVSSSNKPFDFARVGAFLVGVGGVVVALGAVVAVRYNLI